MISLAEIKKSFLVSLWFMFLTFPIMVIRVNTIYKRVEWRWDNMLLVGIGSFFFSFLWRYLIAAQRAGTQKSAGRRSRSPGYPLAAAHRRS